MSKLTAERALFTDPAGPVEELTWGEFVIDGKHHSGVDEDRVGKGKDICVIGRKVTRWKERKGHVLDKSMIMGIYEDNVDTLVIGNGVDGAVRVPDEVRKDAEKHGIQLIVQPTAQACRTYNDLYRKGERVALLAHGTC